MKVNEEMLNKIIRHYRDDESDMEMITRALECFEEYHRAIYRLEITRRLHSCGAIESDRYRSETVERDRSRTLKHNAVIAQVNYLNRLAEEAGLPLFYEGIVSEERPYRREVAAAVLEFVEETIRNRA